MEAEVPFRFQGEAGEEVLFRFQVEGVRCRCLFLRVRRGE